MEYTLKLNQQDIQTIAAGLGELQFKIVVQIMNKIQEQVYSQEREKGEKDTGEGDA